MMPIICIMRVGGVDVVRVPRLVLAHQRVEQLKHTAKASRAWVSTKQDVVRTHHQMRLKQTPPWSTMLMVPLVVGKFIALKKEVWWRSSTISASSRHWLLA